MSNELLSILEYMEKEKGINRVEMIEYIVTAIKNSAKKGVNAGQELKIEINPKTGALNAWSLLKVVDSVVDPTMEIHIEKARQLMEQPKIGDILEREIDPAQLGRIAAQTARHAIMQKLRTFEKNRIYDECKDLVGEIVSGIVRRRDSGDLIVEVGRAEALLPKKESIWNEEYAPGDRIRCLLLKIDQTLKGPEIILSRSHTYFIRRLFELEVAEIADGTVVIKNIAREPGYRTKLCVDSTDPNVDPVGACVGARGARVKNIVKELGGEKIDIVRYHEDPKKLLEEAIKPAIPKNIKVDTLEHRLSFEVSNEDLAVAIGRKGQNAKLTSRLIGWKLDIHPERSEGFDERKSRAIESFEKKVHLPKNLIEKLLSAGITNLEAFEEITSQDLSDSGFSEEEVATLLEKRAQYLTEKGK